MKIAVVTGASSGMGREFVLQLGYLYKDLDEIWVIARRRERMENLKAYSRVPLRIFDGDLMKKPVYKAFYTELKTLQPQIKMLINAAGFGKSGSVEEIAAESKKLQTDMIDLNCRALTRITLMCLSYMEQGSRIVNLASAAAFCPQPGFSVYAATKSYVLSFSRSLGQELKDRKIYVTAVCPGPVETEFFEVSGKPEKLLKKLTMADPEKVVHQALKDSRDRKPVSIYGLPMKAASLFTRFLPLGLILKFQSL